MAFSRAVVAIMVLAVFSSANARSLLAALDSKLQVPASCKAAYTCKGSGDQLYVCNGTALTGTGSDVKLDCGNGVTGTYTYNGKTPYYKLSCGATSGDPATQLRVSNPSGMAVDSTLYRRDAMDATGCLAGIKYIVRSAATGGLPTDSKCTTKDKASRIPYSGEWQFLKC